MMMMALVMVMMVVVVVVVVVRGCWIACVTQWLPLAMLQSHQLTCV